LTTPSWGYGYDPLFWDYGYDDIYAGVFYPYGYDDLAAYMPSGGGGYRSRLDKRLNGDPTRVLRCRSSWRSCAAMTAATSQAFR
jgi:hypothetical protein